MNNFQIQIEGETIEFWLSVSESEDEAGKPNGKFYISLDAESKCIPDYQSESEAKEIAEKIAEKLKKL